MCDTCAYYLLRLQTGSDILVYMNELRTSHDPDELLGARAASEMLPGVGYQSLLRWAKAGDVPHVRLPNGRVFFRRSDIEALLEPVSPERSTQTRDVPIPGLGRAGR